MEVTYVSGTGLLLGSGDRWLLLASGEVDGSALDELWALVTGPAVASSALTAALDRLTGPTTPMAYVDTSTGATSSRGGATVTERAGGHVLSLEPAADTAGPDAGLPLVAGVVRASSAVLEPATAHVTAAGGGLIDGLIDGVPPDILAASAPAPAPAAPPPAAPPPVTTAAPHGDVPHEQPHERTVRRASVDTDHDGRTTYRPEEAVTSPPSAHLQQSTHETVLAAYCPTGHLTEAFTPTCRVCGAAVPPQQPQRLPRPRLGVLHLPDGETVPLDRGVVLGRLPAPVPGRSDWPHLVRLPDDATFVSRSHLSVELDGWLVVATDLGSRGGTTLRVPGRPAERIRAHEPYVWEPGQVLDLADSYEIVYEVSA